LTKAYVLNCDLICWVSDVQTAFLTTHEKKEYDSIHNLLKQNSIETGTLYQMAVVLSKYNYGDTVSDNESVDGFHLDPLDVSDEIMSDDEDTTVHDCYKRVKEVFNDSPVIMKFNSFGRVLNYAPKLAPLYRLVKKTCSASLRIRRVSWAIMLGYSSDFFSN
jgi:hypothetical protein